MSEKPFTTLKGCTIEIGLEPRDPSGLNIEYWEKITTSDGRVLRWVSTNLDQREDLPNDDGIDLMVLAEATRVGHNV